MQTIRPTTIDGPCTEHVGGGGGCCLQTIRPTTIDGPCTEHVGGGGGCCLQTIRPTTIDGPCTEHVGGVEVAVCRQSGLLRSMVHVLNM